ncbi:patatin-like phospholipase family protein [Salirhabdus sp. Marseille-P4669]|uniref:patatin-like phospholipase family protein n=1 Tax=Salirhabdus sp. Marseille-P4669 TaxID=2042310 RepID=UPI000C7C2BCE|nr:patatin-like phospholipase family protein [Salirhabdus sp. Marseille-P4669]
MKVDGVFSGGGVKALAFIGALEAVEEKGLGFERLAGTSAGSIFASLVAAGYTADELKEIFLKLDMSSFIQEPKIGKAFPFLKWVLLYFRLGLYKSEPVEEWLREMLAAKGIETFGDFPKGYLKMIGTDVSLNKLIVFPDDIEKMYNIESTSFSVAKAATISSTIPFFFIPSKITNYMHTKSVLVDGGFLSNFPIWLFTEPDKKKLRPILGMKLSSTYEDIKEKEVDGAIDLYASIFTTMMKAHDARHISKTLDKEVMFIPTEGIEATDFEIDKKSKLLLIDMGYERATKFLKKWSY